MCPFSILRPSEASHRPSVRPTTPTASSTRSASTVCFLLSSALPLTAGAKVTFTPVAVFSTPVVTVEVWISMPCFLYSRPIASPTSLSSTGSTRSIISMIVTFVPIVW